MTSDGICEVRERWTLAVMGTVGGRRVTCRGAVESGREALYDHQDHAQATLQAGRLQEYIEDRERVLAANRKRKNRWR